MVHEPDIAVIEAVIGSDLYRQALRLREAVLREPLGLTITAEELADDAVRQHFCAISYGVVIGSVSLKPLDETTLQLKQMAVAEDRRRERIGALLLAHAEEWGGERGLFPDGAQCSHGRRGLLCAVRLPCRRRAIR
jgi:GNAT superfamily N-acetyltransferase